MIDNTLIETLKNYFADRKEVAAVFIYGSHVGGQPRTDSDVDVAILLTTYDPDAESAQRTLYMAELSRMTRKVIHPVSAFLIFVHRRIKHSYPQITQITQIEKRRNSGFRWNDNFRGFYHRGYNL